MRIKILYSEVYLPLHILFSDQKTTRKEAGGGQGGAGLHRGQRDGRHWCGKRRKRIRNGRGS